MQQPFLLLHAHYIHDEVSPALEMGVVAKKYIF